MGRPRISRIEAVFDDGELSLDRCRTRARAIVEFFRILRELLGRLFSGLGIVSGALMPQPDEPIPAESSAANWRGRILLIIAALAAAVVFAARAGVITLPGAKPSTGAQTSAQAALAAKRTAADQQWASTVCTNLVQWKTALQRDATSLDLGFGLPARVSDALATTTHMLAALDRLGLPPAAHSAQARADTNQLLSEISSRATNFQDAATSIASGNLAAVGPLLNDLKGGTTIGAQVVRDLRHVVSVDLGLSLVETRACRQLVGIPV